MRAPHGSTRVLLALVLLAAAPSSAAGFATGAGAPSSTSGLRAACPTFPADNWWHADVSRLPLHARSAQWLSHMSTDRDLHPDFGPSYGDGPNYGIPVTVVDGTHAKVRVRFDYASESDKVRYPLGDDTRIEGGRNSGGDMHAIVVDRSTCKLYETWNTRVSGSTWRAGSGAVWSLTSNDLRPDGWTSADAAGLPIFPGLVRYDEAVTRGAINHALRFTCPTTRRAYVSPARHWASSQTSTAYPPMGMRVRLKASVDISSYPAEVRVILTALKKYGMFLADNGSGFYISGAPDSRWSDDNLATLRRLTAANFELVQMGTIVTP